jgi:hypothetical protein
MRLCYKFLGKDLASSRCNCLLLYIVSLPSAATGMRRSVDHSVVSGPRLPPRILVKLVGFEDFTMVTMKSALSWDIKPTSYLKGNTLRLRYKAQAFNAM